MIFRLNAAIRLFPRPAFAESEERGGRKKNRREKKKSLERSNEEREAGIVEEEEEEVEDRFDRSKYRERRGGEKRERERGCIVSPDSWHRRGCTNARATRLASAHLSRD